MVLGFDKLRENNDFIINDFSIINNFKIISKRIYPFLKFGETYNYLKFNGEINKKKVVGFVCLEDENIYKLKYVDEK